MQKKIICAESSHIIMPLMVPSAETFAANACYGYPVRVNM